MRLISLAIALTSFSIVLSAQDIVVTVTEAIALTVDIDQVDLTIWIAESQNEDGSIPSSYKNDKQLLANKKSVKDITDFLTLNKIEFEVDENKETSSDTRRRVTALGSAQKGETTITTKSYMYLKNLNKAQIKSLQELVKYPSNYGFTNISIYSEAYDQVETEAYGKAIDQAKLKAQKIAKAAGNTIGKMKEIELLPSEQTLFAYTYDQSSSPGKILISTKELWSEKGVYSSRSVFTFKVTF